MPARKYAHLIGQVFNRWTVVALSGKRCNTFYWLCRCACGTERPISQQHLVGGASKSCGCWNREVACARMKIVAKTHGMSDTGLFQSWCSMKNRCLNPRNKDYKNYGGRGISVTNEWLSFEPFLRDMGSSWQPRLTIERRDVNGNYCKENCYWTTKGKQGYNRRGTLWVTYEDKRMCCSEAARLSGISKHTLRRRILRKTANLFEKAT